MEDPASRNTRSTSTVETATVGIVVVGLLCLPLPLMVTILGRVPVRGALLAAALLLTVTWTVTRVELTRASHRVGEARAHARIRPGAPLPR